MSVRRLLRWAGLVTMISALIFLATDIFRQIYLLTSPDMGFVEEITSPPLLAASAIYLLADILSTAGLFGLYMSQWKAVGPLGLVGFILALAGQTLVQGSDWSYVFVLPALGAETQTNVAFSVALPWYVRFGNILSYATFSLGWLLFGIATYRAGVYRRRASMLLILGSIILLLFNVLFDLVFTQAFNFPYVAVNWGILFGAILWNIALVWLGHILFSSNRSEIAG